jgi:predicted transposase YdaD
MLKAINSVSIAEKRKMKKGRKEGRKEGRTESNDTLSYDLVLK